uniref:Uncharacterized protein n=1 Tax=Acrobeloides nanus TaxID=290746 RepID=A0A914C8U6_9BILA
MLKFDNENGNKTTDFMSRLCKLTPPGTGLLQFNFNEAEGSVIAQFQWRYGSWMWEANYDTMDTAQVEKTMRAIISSAEFMSIQSEESAKQLTMDDKSTWSTPEYPWGPFQFGVKHGPGVSKNQRQEMEDERRKFEEAKGVWPITNIQCILLSIIVIFGMAVALAAIDFKVQVEEEQPLEGLEMQPKQKSEESSASKTAVLPSARHSSTKAEVDTTKTKRTQ